MDSSTGTLAGTDDDGKELLARGVNVVTSQDDVNDPYYPFGKPDPLECVSMIAHVAQLTLPHDTWPAVVGPATRAAETVCEQRIALRDHIVDIRRLALIASSFVERAPQRFLTGWRCLGRLLPFCHRHARFDRVCYETILMCSVMHLIEFFCTGSSVAAPCDLRA